jgi:hypothetical protein
MSSPAESPHRPKDPSPRSKLLGKRKAFVFDGESSDEEPTTPQAGKTIGSIPQRVDELRDDRDAQLRELRRKSGPQAVANYQQFKGRGRYAVPPQCVLIFLAYLHIVNIPNRPGNKTINSEFEINPTHNEGMAFQFDSVVRDKNERKKLVAGDCIACKEVSCSQVFGALS